MSLLSNNGELVAEDPVAEDIDESA